MIALSWSGGKDSYLALLHLMDEGRKVDRLVSTVDENLGRISMHGVPSSLIQAQADALGIPIEWVKLPAVCTMEDHSRIMKDHFRTLEKEGFSKMIYGDIFLKDLRQYREELLQSFDLMAEFPLWGMDTAQLAQSILKLDIKALTVAVSDHRLGKSFCGIPLDKGFLDSLPDQVDPCGENGEFHTFVTHGPYFSKAVDIQVRKVVLKGYGGDGDGWDHQFWFADLHPATLSTGGGF